MATTEHTTNRRILHEFFTRSFEYVLRYLWYRVKKIFWGRRARASFWLHTGHSFEGPAVGTPPAFHCITAGHSTPSAVGGLMVNQEKTEGHRWESCNEGGVEFTPYPLSEPKRRPDNEYHAALCRAP